MTLTIYIISNAKTPELHAITQQAVDTARATTPEGTRIVVYEQCGLVGPATYGGAEYVQNLDKPFSYSKACNWCINDCQTDIIGIFNNDVIFFPNWWAEIQKAFAGHDELMSVSPLCKKAHPELYKANRLHEPGPFYGYAVRVNVCGWALVFRKKLIDIIGPFDERFPFWYSDNDYAKTMEKHGVLHALIPTARVDHIESKTLKTMPDQNSLTHKHKAKFDQKWGIE